MNKYEICRNNECWERRQTIEEAVQLADNIAYTRGGRIVVKKTVTVYEANIKGYVKQEYPNACINCNYKVDFCNDDLEGTTTLLCCYGIEDGKEGSGVPVDKMGICPRYIHEKDNSINERYWNRKENE